MKMNRYLNVVKTDTEVADAQKKLLAVYDCLPLADFKEVDKSDF